MNIKDLFNKAENGTLTYDEFEALAKENEAKFADLSEGKYVSKSKYESDLKAVNQQVEGLNTQISDLNTTITARDTDLADLQKRLEDAGQDATKLADITSQFETLQNKYQADMDAYQAKLNQQSYEFAVKEFANTKHFSSNAAKRDFTQTMIARQLQMEDGKILGRDDFAEAYAKENEDAFVVEKPEPTPEPTPAPEPEVKPEPAPPVIVTSAEGVESKSDGGFGFNFVGVRAPKK